MKLAALALVSCFLVAQSAVISNPEAEVQRTIFCQQSSGVSNKALKRLSKRIFDNDPNVKEYLWCTSRNAGFLDDRGYFQTDIIRMRLKVGHYSADTIDDVVHQCTQLMDTPQETAFQFMKCVHRTTFPLRYR